MSEEQNQAEDPTLQVEKFFREKDIPTKADLERVFTNEELTELSIKHKCRVDMWRWNVVNDYRVVFTEKGRYQRWPEKLRLKMLAYAVNLRKPEVLYEDTLIAQTRKKEHEMQIKENILSLNYWKRLREEELEGENTDDKAVASFEITDSSESIVGSGTQPELEDANVLNISFGESSETTEIENQLGASTSGNSASCHVFENINTESMTLNTEFASQSQENQPLEDLLHDYINFDKDIPMTSTQSQEAESQQL